MPQVEQTVPTIALFTIEVDFKVTVVEVGETANVPLETFNKSVMFIEPLKVAPAELFNCKVLKVNVPEEGLSACAVVPINPIVPPIVPRRETGVYAKFNVPLLVKEVYVPAEAIDIVAPEEILIAP